jgi:hypothetical protein
MYRWLIIAALLTTMCGAVYFYYNTTQKTIQQLISNNATLQSNVKTLIEANETNVKTIDELQTSYIEVQENYTRIENEFQNIRAQNTILNEKFENSDLGKLAAAKPELIERIINNASDDALRCFELLSGSPLTEDERKATNATQFNSECPFLWRDTP